jgi:hypothetical protein
MERYTRTEKMECEIENNWKLYDFQSLELIKWKQTICENQGVFSYSHNSLSYN